MFDVVPTVLPSVVVRRCDVFVLLVPLPLLDHVSLELPTLLPVYMSWYA